jgi:class 3 adenylate cyclase
MSVAISSISATERRTEMHGGSVLLDLLHSLEAGDGDRVFAPSPDPSSVLHEIERFVKGVRADEASLERVLATVLFTDIVGSTEKAAELGDRGWRELLEEHHATVRRLLARYRGT